MSIVEAPDVSRHLAGAGHARPPAAQKVKEIAVEFEAAFFSEMLSHAGLDSALAARSGFGGESMVSFLIAEISRQIAAEQSLGIANLVGRSLGRQS